MKRTFKQFLHKTIAWTVVSFCSMFLVLALWSWYNVTKYNSNVDRVERQTEQAPEAERFWRMLSGEVETDNSPSGFFASDLIAANSYFASLQPEGDDVETPRGLTYPTTFSDFEAPDDGRYSDFEQTTGLDPFYGVDEETGASNNYGSLNDDFISQIEAVLEDNQIPDTPTIKPNYYHPYDLLLLERIVWLWLIAGVIGYISSGFCYNSNSYRWFLEFHFWDEKEVSLGSKTYLALLAVVPFIVWLCKDMATRLYRALCGFYQSQKKNLEDFEKEENNPYKQQLIEARAELQKLQAIENPTPLVTQQIQRLEDLIAKLRTELPSYAENQEADRIAQEVAERVTGIEDSLTSRDKARAELNL